MSIQAFVALPNDLGSEALPLALFGHYEGMVKYNLTTIVEALK